MNHTLIRSALLTMLTISLVAINGCKPSGEKIPGGKIMSGKTILADFHDPSPEFRTVPFWVWNEKVTEKMIDEQLAMFKENGFGGVFVHPRYGMITEYGGPEWYDLVKYASDRAEDLGLKLWLYDENSFPSGFAGGHVPDRMPESWNQGTGMTAHQMKVLNLDPEKEWIAFFAINNGNYRNITDEVDNLEGSKGDFLGIEKTFYEKSKWFAGFSYVDLLYPGVTEKFIEVTMNGYEDKLGDRFGNTVPGIFTDEPNISPRNNALRFTPALFSEFESKWGYRLQDYLPSLFLETGDWKKVRHNYYSVLLDMFIDRWAIPWHEYTQQKGLMWTGHYWEHGWPDPVHGGDNMAMYAYHQLPGIDLLFNTWEKRPDQFGNVRLVKELSSMANQFGALRTLCETYGASGYELSFEDMKRNGDWMYALGVNLMNQHLSYQSMLGDRKHDFPQTFSYHASWWRDYRAHADYYARLSLALSAGEQWNDLLVLEPTTSGWLYASAGENRDALNKIEKDFREFVDWLEYHKYAYDLGSENTLHNFGSVANNRIRIGEREYSVLILPPGMENLDSYTLEIIASFLEQGGKMYIFSKVLSLVDGKETSSINSLFEKFPDQVIMFPDPGSQPDENDFNSGDVRFTNRPSDHEQVYYMYRKLDDGAILFLANSARGKSRTFGIQVKGMFDMVELDPGDGKIYAYDFEKKSDGLTADIVLDDACSKLFYVSQKKIKQKRDRKVKPGEPVYMDTYISEIRRNEPNVLCLDYCRLKFPGETAFSEQMYFYKAHDLVYQKYGFPDNPWVSSSQFKTGTVDRDTFPPGTGFTVKYSFFIKEGVDLSGLKIVIERPALYTLKLNGKILMAEDGEWYMDKGTGVFNASSDTKIGVNEIELVADPFSVFHELAPVFVLGNFSLIPAGQGWITGPERPLDMGSWKDLGLPFYPASISFTSRLEVENTSEDYFLELKDFNASCVSLSVNEKDPVYIWPPYTIRISDYLGKGENRITLTLHASLKNLVGPHHNVNIDGLVTPWSFKYAPESQPGGLDYDLVDYGLFNEFRIFKSE